jgi:hypothetical protein
MKKVVQKKYFSILGICFLIFLGGVLLGFLFYQLFSTQSADLISKYKIIQSIFGIREYDASMSYMRTFWIIFAANLVSTLGYFALGYLRLLIPISLITGFFIIVFLLSGLIRHETSTIPLEVIILVSWESVYRILALSTGEYIQKNRLKRKYPFIISTLVILGLFIGAVFFELNILFV